MDRTCASCGAQVGILADRCPVCGGDPDVRLIEVGARARRTTPPPDATGATGGTSVGGSGLRRWAPLAAGLVGLWAIVALTTGNPGGGDGAAQAIIEEATTTEVDDDTATTVRRRPRPLTTTTALVLPGAPLLGEPNGLTAVLVGDRAALIDLDSGMVRRLPQMNVIGAVTGGLLVNVSEGVAVWPPPYDGSGARLLRPSSADIAWVAGGGSGAWLAAGSADGRQIDVTLVDVGGEVLLDYDLPSSSWPVGAVDAGLVIGAPGGTYLLTPAGGIERLSTGNPIAAGGDRIHVSNCDESLRCGLEVVDGDGVVIERAADEDERGLFPGVWIAAVAPDGRVAYVDGEGPDAAVLVDGRMVATIGFGGASAMDWSPDGRWLALANHANDLWLIDTFTGAPPIVVELPPGYGPPWQVHLLPST